MFGRNAVIHSVASWPEAPNSVEEPIPRRVETDKLGDSQVVRVSRTVFYEAPASPCELLFIFGTVQADWDGLAASILDGQYERVILAGCTGPSWTADRIPIAQVMRDELVRRGVSASDLELQEVSTNTLEDVSQSLTMIGRPDRMVFAAKSHHSGRCARTLRRFLPTTKFGAHLYDAVQDGVVLRREDWNENDIARSFIIGEYQRILRYSANGDIALYP